MVFCDWFLSLNQYFQASSIFLNESTLLSPYFGTRVLPLQYFTSFQTHVRILQWSYLSLRIFKNSKFSPNTCYAASELCCSSVFFFMLGIEPLASHVLGRCPTTELYPHSLLTFSNSACVLEACIFLMSTFQLCCQYLTLLNFLLKFFWEVGSSLLFALSGANILDSCCWLF